MEKILFARDNGPYIGLYTTRSGRILCGAVWKDGTKGPHCTEKQFMCPGNCSECAIVGCGCWNAKKGETILFEAH